MHCCQNDLNQGQAILQTNVKVKSNLTFVICYVIKNCLIFCRSLQRGAWQESVSSFQPGSQFRSLQRSCGPTTGSQAAQFRSVKIQDQPQIAGDGMYANGDNERQLYAVTEL